MLCNNVKLTARSAGWQRSTLEHVEDALRALVQVAPALRAVCSEAIAATVGGR